MTIQEAKIALEEFKALENNWDEDDAKKPDEVSLANASKFLDDLSRLNETEIYHTCPGPSGEISIELKYSNRELELLFYPNHTNVLMFNVVALQGVQFEYKYSNISSYLIWLYEDISTKI